MNLEMIIVGGAMPPNFAELDRIENELLETVNSARLCFERGECGAAEYGEALRRLNEFAINKPLSGNLRLMGLEDPLKPHERLNHRQEAVDQQTCTAGSRV
jgi:hypothetical protein